MTFYESEIIRIRSVCYSNHGQLNTVIAMKKYVDSNYNSKLNLDLLSKLHFTSKYHLLRLFKKYYGFTPKQYLTDIRIAKAKRYLTEGHSVTATCFKVGFESLGSFSSLFRVKTGLTPRQFRKSAILKK